MKFLLGLILGCLLGVLAGWASFLIVGGGYALYYYGVLPQWNKENGP